MTREEARLLVQGLLKSYGIESEGLNSKGLGGVQVQSTQIYFEHDDSKGTLKCSAHIYRFRDPPKPGILEAARREAQSGTDTGGGAVDYEPENKGLFLSRTYSSVPDAATFKADAERLLKASEVWSAEVLARVATKVFHPEDATKS